MKVKSMLISGAMALLLFANSFSMSANAADIKEIPDEEVDSVYNMQVDSNAWDSWARGPHIYSESGIVMDMDSGAILYAKNIDDKHYPASITKVMTALVALQNYKMDETVKFTWDDIGFLEYGDAHIAIKEHEEVLMEDCMYGMLLASANEVSHAIGAHMEGGYEAFLAEMNKVSAEIGCKNSHWMNTHGLHDPEHYTTVRDMAIIGSEVFQYEKFREITGTYQHVIPETALTNEVRYVHQNHKMIREGHQHYYEYCVGGKTGYTDQALTTLVTFATKDDMNLVAVVMRTHGGGNNAYQDTREMLEFAFDNFQKTPITKEMIGNEHIESISANAHVTLPEGVTVQQLTCSYTEPTELEDMTGDVIFYYGENPVGEAEATITEEYYKQLHNIKEEKPKQDKDTSKEKKGMPIILKVIVTILFTGIILFTALTIYVVLKRRQLEKKRKLRRQKYLREKYGNYED